jgi:anti-anti-sigma regulatory factor
MLPPLPLLAISVERQGECLALVGELIASDAEQLVQWFTLLTVVDTPHCLQLGELDIMDGVAATHMVNIVRLMLQRCGKVLLSEAPQLLPHNLYRAGLFYEGCDITLEGMREDEPYG